MSDKGRFGELIDKFARHIVNNAQYTLSSTPDELNARIPRPGTRAGDKFAKNIALGLGLTPMEKALAAAHDAAMLPKSKGGLDLHLGNTAVQRAAALGFDTPAYHYSQAQVPIDEFKPLATTGEAFDLVGVHSGTKRAAEERFLARSGYEGLDLQDVLDHNMPVKPIGQTLPLLIKNEKPYQSKLMLRGKLRELPTEGELQSLLGELDNPKTIWDTYDTLPYQNLVEDPGSKSYISPPKNVRSRFAAFNPLLRDSKDIMAGLSSLGLFKYLNNHDE